MALTQEQQKQAFMAFIFIFGFPSLLCHVVGGEASHIDGEMLPTTRLEHPDSAEKYLASVLIIAAIGFGFFRGEPTRLRRQVSIAPYSLMADGPERQPRRMHSRPMPP